MVARFLVLTEDSGKQGQPTVQALARAAISLVAPGLDTRRFEFLPAAGKERLVEAVSGNGWKARRAPGNPRLLNEIANSLLRGFVIFHVDSDTSWEKRSRSENRAAFDTIIRRGVSLVLQGHAPNPIGRNAPNMTEAEAALALRRLFVMQPCYSIESWLYQAADRVAELCRATHASSAHQALIASWAEDRALLDEIERPKDEALGDCVRDHHNATLARSFPADDVRAAQRSWAEFVDQLAQSDDLLARLASPV